MTNKIWNYIKKNKTVCVLNIIVFLILVVPYSYSFGNQYETEELHWTQNFVFKEIDLIIFYLPILILTIGFQLTKKAIWRNTLLILNLVVSILYFFGALYSLSFPIQDFSPGIGNLLILTLFPLIIIIFKIEQYERNKNKKTIANNV
ncbi:hypothetical protein [Mangrovimonas cancribranchiae]|uniref:DUF4293 family protein n=1 Tax=Mangrovimonas cancribranchiae TaxID=3080055 RepID=A0AAU6P4E2_9FLAO